VRLCVDSVQPQHAGLPIHDGVNPPDQPIPVQDRQHVVAELALGDRDVDLQLEAEVEEEERAVAVGDQRVKRAEQHRARCPRAVIELGEGVAVGEPLPWQVIDLHRHGDAIVPKRLLRLGAERQRR